MTDYLIYNQAAQGSQAVAEHSGSASGGRIQRNRFVCALHTGRHAEKIDSVDGFLSVERGISTAKESFIYTNQTVQNKSVVFAVEQNRAGARIARAERTDADGLSVAHGRRHARAASTEADRRVLLKQAGNDGLVQLGFSRHTKEF